MQTEGRRQSGQGPMVPVSPLVASAARALWMELAAADAWTHLNASGIPAVLLKGPAIATWLYDDNEVRTSRDVDLLVPPDKFDDAKVALQELGYQTELAGAPACEVGPNAEVLFGTNGVCIDLHHRLIGIPDPPELSWTVLRDRTTTLRLAMGVDVQVLDVPARTMHLALHAAQNGPIDVKAVADLERGLARVALADWQEAAKLAQTLGALPAFTGGLRLCPAGVRLSDELLLAASYSVELMLRVTSAPQESLFFARLARVRGLRPKASLVARKLWPTAGFMRSQYSFAGRGRMGVFVARCARAVSLPRRSGPAVLAFWRARAHVRRAKPPPR